MIIKSETNALFETKPVLLQLCRNKGAMANNLLDWSIHRYLDKTWLICFGIALCLVDSRPRIQKFVMRVGGVLADGMLELRSGTSKLQRWPPDAAAGALPAPERP